MLPYGSVRSEDHGFPQFGTIRDGTVQYRQNQYSTIQYRLVHTLMKTYGPNGSGPYQFDGLNSGLPSMDCTPTMSTRVYSSYFGGFRRMLCVRCVRQTPDSGPTSYFRQNRVLTSYAQQRTTTQNLQHSKVQMCMITCWCDTVLRSS